MPVATSLDVPHTEWRLRPLEPADIEPWYAYLSMPHVVEHTSWNLKSAEDLRPLVDRLDPNDPAAEIRFAINRGADRRLLGTIGFHSISPVHRTAEIAYDLHPSQWGRGVASACCRALLDWGYAARGYVRIQAVVLEANRASVRVLEKCGFAYEGRLRNYRLVRGEPRDFLLYAALPPR